MARHAHREVILKAATRPTKREGSSPRFSDLALIDLDLLDDAWRRPTNQFDMEQAMLQTRAENLDTICQNERFLELPRRDAPMKHLPLRLFGLRAAADDKQIAILDRNIEITLGNPATASVMR